MEKAFILGQVLTLFSYLIFWGSRFVKTKNGILLGDNISRFFAIVAFVFLGTYDGIKNTVYAIFRNALGQVTNKKEIRYKKITFIMLLVILILMYDFNNLSTISIAICGIINLYAVIMCDEQNLRKLGMIASVFYTGFMILTGNVVGVICEIISFLVVLISYIKYRNK